MPLRLLPTQVQPRSNQQDPQYCQESNMIHSNAPNVAGFSLGGAGTIKGTLNPSFSYNYHLVSLAPSSTFSVQTLDTIDCSELPPGSSEDFPDMVSHDTIMDRITPNATAPRLVAHHMYQVLQTLYLMFPISKLRIWPVLSLALCRFPRWTPVLNPVILVPEPISIILRHQLLMVLPTQL